ncbi:hypothetical protein [Actinomadura nitritigenes]|uniref:hypothetical protein n=1 Tax=Actinomadura nitritigenes TaxID=134602 RepID=UPI003D8E33C7
MPLDQPVPRILKVVDTDVLVTLEETALRLSLSQRLPVAWVVENVAPEGRHYLWPAFWHRLSHRPDIPDHMRCELLLRLRTGDQVRSLLDVLPVDFDPLANVTSSDEGRQVGHLLNTELSVRDWDLRRAEGASASE